MWLPFLHGKCLKALKLLWSRELPIQIVCRRVFCNWSVERNIQTHFFVIFNASVHTVLKQIKGKAVIKCLLRGFNDVLGCLNLPRCCAKLVQIRISCRTSLSAFDTVVMIGSFVPSLTLNWKSCPKKILVPLAHPFALFSLLSLWGVSRVVVCEQSRSAFYLVLFFCVRMEDWDEVTGEEGVLLEGRREWAESQN